VKAMCEFFGVPRASYYAWTKKIGQEDTDRDHIVLVQEAYNASHQVYGYRRIVLWIQQKPALKINHKAVLRLMNKLNIRSRARKRKMYRKLEEIGTYHRDPNILNRILLPPDQTRNGSPILPMS
jgi:putative transposase